MIPDAARATIRAAVEDAHRTELDPAEAAEHVVAELDAQGWTVDHGGNEQAPGA